jgi:hypothetical protein
VIEDGGRNSETLSLLAAALGTLAVLALSAFSANAFVSERVSQTLEVLMTTPLSARDMVRQKARMLTRFMWVVAAPLMTVFVVEWWMESESSYRYVHDVLQTQPSSYLLCSVLTLAIYLPLVLWLSLWIGLKMKTRFRAIITALAVVVAWCVLPLICGVILQLRTPSLESTLLALTSPLAVPAGNEVFGLRELFPHQPLLGVLCNFSIYGLILVALRHRCLAQAERYLRGGRQRRKLGWPKSTIVSRQA